MGVLSTRIQWTDETWNPVTGCSRVSEGCRNCYIERTPPFRMGGRKLGYPVQLHHDRLEQPLHWKKPRRVFVNSLSDLFHESVSDDYIDEVFALMALAPHHTFQILTKRPHRMRTYLTISHGNGTFRREGLVKGRALSVLGHFPKYQHNDVLMRLWPLANVWLGVSVEDQQTADERIPILLQTPAAVRWVSAEPLLGPVDLSMYLRPPIHIPGRHVLLSAGSWIVDADDKHLMWSGVSWVVVGGESGPKARPCDVGWLRSIVGQCKAAAVPCFVKQLGDYVVDRNDAGFDGEMPTDWPMGSDVDDPANEWDWQGAKIRVRLNKKGGDPAEWPKDLMVREWPP